MSAVTFQSGTLATPPAGTAVAVDVIAAEQHQQIKMEWGGAGVATAVTATTPMPVGTAVDLDTGAGTDTKGALGLLYADAGGAKVVGLTQGLPVNVVGGSAANAAAGATGIAVPTSADYTGLSVAGTLRGATALSVGTQIAQAMALVDASGVQITSLASAGVVSGYHRITTADTNPVNINAASSKLRAVRAYNNADYPIYLCFHNTAGAPTAGVSVVRKYGIQAGTARDIPIQGGGLQFGTGLAMTVVKGLADADATAVAASDATIEVEYE